MGFPTKGYVKLIKLLGPVKSKADCEDTQTDLQKDTVLQMSNCVKRKRYSQRREPKDVWTKHMQELKKYFIPWLHHVKD